MNKNTDIVGRGWAFPPQRGNRGRVALTGGPVDEIEQSIRIILGTAQGERVMRPTFGSRLHELVFAPINAETMALAHHYVTEALNMWEPRIRLEKVEIVDPFEREPNLATEGKLYIAIEYEIKKTLDERTLVYPFAIIPEE